MENKTGKYFKYAIGEIVLVVIGILIALQINNWNEKRLNSNKETVILANIHKEFNENQKQLDSVVSLHKRVFKHTTKIINFFPIQSKPKQSVLDSLSVHLWFSYPGFTFNPSQSSINALMSTSSFDIVTDETLRNLLISWNDLVEDYQEEEISARDYTWNQYDPYLSKHFDWNFNFKDERNNFEALQTLEFEHRVRNINDLVKQIIQTTGELKKLQDTLEQIIELSKPENND